MAGLTTFSCQIIQSEHGGWDLSAAARENGAVMLIVHFTKLPYY